MSTDTTNCRIYRPDNSWILKRRGLGNAPDTIHKLIKFYESFKHLLKEADLE
jgi:hypothetical protein